MRDIYTFFCEEEERRVAKGNKAETIRTFVKLFASKYGETKLVRSATWHALCNAHEEKDITQSYFAHVTSREWNILRDEKGVVWIDLSKPRRQR